MHISDNKRTKSLLTSNTSSIDIWRISSLTMTVSSRLWVRHSQGFQTKNPSKYLGNPTLLLESGSPDPPSNGRPWLSLLWVLFGFISTYLFLHSVVIDVYRPNSGRVVLIDINPFGETTDSLLFDWEELSDQQWDDSQVRDISTGFGNRDCLVYQLRVKWHWIPNGKFVISIIMYEKYQGIGNENFSKGVKLVRLLGR